MAGEPELYGRMWKPPGFKHHKSHPTLVHVYGGPYSQMVHYIWLWDWFIYCQYYYRLQKHQYFITCGQSTWHHSIIWLLLVLMAEVLVSMATSKDHISQYVWSCDVNSFKYSVYRHLGILETVDQLRAGQYLSSLSYVDGSHLSIYGTVSGKNSYSKTLHVNGQHI